MVVFLLLIMVAMVVGLIYKIKKLQYAQKSYEINATKYQIIVENSADLIACYDTHSRITYFNPQLEIALNVSYKDVIGLTPTELVLDGTYDEYETNLNNVIATGNPNDFYLKISVDQQDQYHFIHLVPIRDALDNIIGAITFGRNITELYQSKNDLHYLNAVLGNEVDARTAKLQATEETFRAIVENTPDTVTRYDLQMRRTYVNPMMQFLLDKPLEEILERTPREFSPLPDIDQFEQMFRTVLQRGTILEIEGPYTTRWGITRWGNQRMIPEFDMEHNVKGIIVIGRDITDQRAMVRRLKLIEAAVISSNEAIYISDHDLSILYCNQKACQMLGYTESEFYRMKICDIDLIFNSNDLDEIIESKHRKRDGSLIDVEIERTAFVFEDNEYLLSIVRNHS